MSGDLSPNDWRAADVSPRFFGPGAPHGHRGAHVEQLEGDLHLALGS